MKLLTTKKAIEAAIVDIQQTGKKLDDMIQVASCSVIAHADKHGDVSLAVALVEAMPKGSRVKALIGHLTYFGKFDATDDGKAIEPKLNKGKDTNLSGAMEKHWTDFKHNDDPKVFDLDALIVSLAKRAAKAKEAGKEGTVIDDERLAVLTQMATAIEAKA